MLGLRLSWEDEREKHNPAAFIQTHINEITI